MANTANTANTADGASGEIDRSAAGTRLISEVVAVDSVGDEVWLTVRAVRCVEVSGIPGYLTGEPLEDQGIETRLPNLPDLQLPPVDPVDYVLRIGWAAPETVRLTLASPDARVLYENATWLGIVSTPRPQPTTPRVRDLGADGRDRLMVDGGRLRVEVRQRPFALQVSDTETGRVLLRTAGGLRQVAGLPLAPALLIHAGGMTCNLELGSNEDVLGFGEHFGPVEKVGQRLTLRTADALGTGTGLVYKPVPVWHSTSGYLGFLNTGAVVTADVGGTRPAVFSVSVADEALDLYVVGSDTPAERLSSYTELTGRSPVPPLWAFGFWQGRCRYHTRAEMEEVGKGMHSRGIPCDVLHLDPDWLVVDRLNCDFVWNEERFGDRRAFIESLRELGFRLSLWELPYVESASPRYTEAQQKGYFVRDAGEGHVHMVGTPRPDDHVRGIVDVTNPDALAWWQAFHEEYLDDGVSVFKTDFGEGVPDGSTLAEGTPPAHSHNLYPLRYNAAVSDVIGRHTGRNPLVWGRSGWAGSHRYPAQWGGDAESSVAGMRATLRGGLSYALSAPGFWSHDIGGFFGPGLSPELYARWLQFGAMSPLMRAHGLRPHEPWQFGDRVLEISREWIRLRYSLLPYLWQVAHQSATCGWPMLRPLGFEYGRDQLAMKIDDTFLLGSDLLVVPIFDDGPEPVTREFYVPDGRWTDLCTGATYQGPGTYTEDVPLERIPLLVRDGALLPRVELSGAAGEVRNTDDLLDRPWALHLHGTGDVDRELVGFDGSVTQVRVADGTNTVSAHGSQPVARDLIRHAG